MTYGAGGSTKGKNCGNCFKDKNDYQIEVSCTFNVYLQHKKEVLEICQQLKDNHIENILSLRGIIHKMSL